jgi:hypothetical protein
LRDPPARGPKPNDVIPDARSEIRNDDVSDRCKVVRMLKRFLRSQPLVRLYALSVATGFALAALFVGALVAFDAGGIATLAAQSGAWPFLLVLWFFSGLTFASAQAGMAIMSLADDGQPGGGKRVRVQQRPALAMAPTTNKT